MKIKEVWEEIPTFVKVVAILGGGFLIYRKVKQLLNKPKPIPLPEGGQGLPVVGHLPDGSPVFWNPDAIASELFNVMSGLFTMSGTKDEAWTRFGQLPSDDMIVSVYNLFNDKYGKGDTLTQWINDEYYTDVAGSGKALALSRLSQLNLK